MTILFLDDWAKYPGAIVDTKTKNQSFLRMAAMYKSMGVKNHAFMLALHNPALQGINPHSPDLTADQMVMIADECYDNFWYFIREVALAPNGEFPLPFKANRGNLALFWLYLNHITVLLIQIRQTGKSFSTDTLMNWLMNIRCRRARITLVTKDETLRSENLGRLKDLMLMLPNYLKALAPSDVANTEEIKISLNENRYRALLPSKSEKMALNVGRGLTSETLQFDEIAFLYNIGLSLPAALAAGTAAMDRAKLNGDPYGIIYTTTAGKKDDRDGKYVYENIYRTSAKWAEALLDSPNAEALINAITKSSVGGNVRVLVEFQHRQLGYTDEWLRDTIKRAEAKGEAAERDFFNKWTSGSISSPFSAAQADIIRGGEVRDYYPQITGKHSYIVRWYYAEHEFENKLRNINHILSLDTSDAVGQDDIGFTIRNTEDGSVSAAGNFNETNIILFAEWIADLLTQFPKLTLIIERKSTGASIIDYLLLLLPARGICPFSRIYNKVVQEKDEYPDRFKEAMDRSRARDLSVYVDYKKAFGFSTSATGLTSRDDLFTNTMSQAVKYTGNLIRDKVLIDQLLGLEIKNGRIDHKAGSHDDMVVSWLLSAWLMFKGKNLTHYGLDPSKFLIRNQVTKEENKPEELFKRSQQTAIRNMIDNLLAELQRTKDPILAQKLETRLKLIASQLEKGSSDALSIDALVEKIKNERNINRPNRAIGFDSYANQFRSASSRSVF